jgi:hypothetical protein
MRDRIQELKRNAVACLVDDVVAMAIDGEQCYRFTDGEAQKVAKLAYRDARFGDGARFAKAQSNPRGVAQAGLGRDDADPGRADFERDAHALVVREREFIRRRSGDDDCGARRVGIRLRDVKGERDESDPLLELGRSRLDLAEFDYLVLEHVTENRQTRAVHSRWDAWGPDVARREETVV